MTRIQRHLLIIAFFGLIYGYFYNGGGGNQVARMNQTRAIVARGTLYSDDLGYRTDDEIRLDGHRYSNKAPGTSLLGVVPYALVHGVDRLLGLRSPFWRNWEVHATTILVVGLPCAIAMWLLYLMLLELGLGPPRAFLGACAVGLGTNYFAYATMYFSHSLAAALCFAAFFLLYHAAKNRGTGRGGLRVLYAGLLVSYAVLTEYPAAIAAVVLSLYLLMTRATRRELLQWCLGGLIGLLALGLYNWAAFGNPLALSYFNYARAAHNTFPQMAKGLGGVTTPDWTVLQALLWGKYRGLLWFAPAFFLALPGLAVLLTRHRAMWRETTTAILMVVGFLLFNAAYGDSVRYWGGANAAGPRHLVPMLPFAGMAMGAAIGAAPLLCLGVVLLSIGVNLAVTATMPQVPMVYFRPIEQMVVPFFLEGRLALHRAGVVGNALVTRDSVAYNWGKLWGLPGSWALLPLLMVIAGLLVVLFRDFHREGQLSRRAYGLSLGVGIAFTAALLLVPLGYQRARQRPLEGPGVLGVYYPGGRCAGVPSWVAREATFELPWGREGGRPYPGTFCAQWNTHITITQGGHYTFEFIPRRTKLWIDHQPVPLTKVGKYKLFGTRTLDPGDHLLTIQHIAGVVHNRFRLRWRPPLGSVSPIHGDRLMVTAELTAGLEP